MRRRAAEHAGERARARLVQPGTLGGRLQCDGDRFRPGLGQRAGLVEADRVERGERLERLEALHQDAAPHERAGSGKQRRRRCERERARAGDDQHRDRHPDRARRVDERPGDGGAGGKGEHAPQERSGDAIRGAQQRRPIGHRRAHQRDDAFVARVGADAIGTLDDGAAQVDAAGDRDVASALRDRPRFAGQQRLVGVGLAFEQHAVGRERFAGENADPVAALEAMDRDQAGSCHRRARRRTTAGRRASAPSSVAATGCAS